MPTKLTHPLECAMEARRLARDDMRTASYARLYEAKANFVQSTRAAKKALNKLRADREAHDTAPHFDSTQPEEFFNPIDEADYEALREYEREQEESDADLQSFHRSM